MKLLKLFFLISFPFMMIASDQEKQDKESMKPLRVPMLYAILQNCDTEIKRLSTTATDVEHAQAYARGFYRSIPDKMPDSMKKIMKFQFILLHNIHPTEATTAKSECSSGLMWASIGAATFTQATAKKAVNTMLAEIDNRIVNAINDQNNKQIYNQGPLSNYLGLRYEEFIQQLAAQAHRINPDTLNYYDVAKELRYLQEQEKIAHLLERYRSTKAEQEFLNRISMLHCEALTEDRAFMKK